MFHFLLYILNLISNLHCLARWKVVVFFIVRQTQQQFLLFDAPCAEVVADEFGYIKRIVGIPSEHVVDTQIAGLYRYTVAAIYIVFQYIVFIRDVEADVFRVTGFNLL